MALKKATKTVLFHDGMGDDSDRFLLEPPSVDYAENLRIDKAGSLQKRPGFGPDALTSVPNSSGTPIALHGIGNDLHVLVDEGVRTWDGSGWREKDAKGFLGGSEVELETQSFLGLGHCAYTPLLNTATGEVAGHVVAYEVRDQPSESGNWLGGAKHIIVQRYDADGLFVDQVRVNNAHSPQVVTADGVPGNPEAAAVFCQSESHFGSLIFSYIFAPSMVDSISWDPKTDTLIQPDYAPQMPQYADTDTGPRLGQGVSGQSRYFVKYNEVTDQFVVFSGGGNSCGLTILDPGTGYPVSGTLERIYADSHGGAYDSIDVLGLDVNQGFIFIVYQVAELSGSGQPVAPWAIYTARYGSNPSLGFTASPINLRSGGGRRDTMPTLTHGTIATVQVGTSGSQASFIAVHYSGHNSAATTAADNAKGAADDWYPWNVRNSDVGLMTFEVNWITNTFTQPAYLHSHRITTNPCYFNNEWYMGVQQWLDYTPQHEDPGGCNQYVLADAAHKPVTTALCVWNQDGGIVPIAALDAGQSSHVDYAESEMAPHVGTLVEHDGALLASNRVKLSAEDVSLYLGSASSVWHRWSNIEVGSKSLCRVHRVTPGGSGLHSADFGDGIALPTAVPTWYESSGIAEFGPLDSPEIIRVEDADYASRTGLTNNAYMQKAPPQGYSEFASTHSLNFRKFVCIWGYTDGRGNTHRSAPSSTLYVADLLEDETSTISGDDTKWGGREVTVYVTTPLSMLSSGREYFLEVYVSTDADTDPQLAAQTSIDITDYGSPKFARFQLNRVIPSDQEIAKTAVRSTAPPYTSGGVLAADPWPSFSKSVVQSTRFWALDKSNKGRVIYSKLFEDYIAPEYNPTLSINLGDERDLTAIGKLDDKVVVFEPDDIHVIYGDGPDNRGQGQDFAVHYIATDVGCTDQESVVETPIGLIFYSEPRGFYLLDRNLQVQFIGGGIEDTARGIDIVSATLVRDKAEVRFVFTGGPAVWDRLGPGPGTTAIKGPPLPVFTNAASYIGPALTFNYERSSWMTYSNYSASAATIYQGKYTMLRSDWDVWQEKEDRWDDPSGYNLTRMMTPWVRLSENVQDFNRLWSMTILGRYLSSLQDLGTNEFEGGDLLVRIYYDYEAISTHSKLYKIQDFQFDPFNDPLKRAERFQVELSPKRGRCQAVKLEFSEQLSEETGEGITYKQGRGFEITAVDFHVGLEPSRTLIPQRSKK